MYNYIQVIYNYSLVPFIFSLKTEFKDPLSYYAFSCSSGLYRPQLVHHGQDSEANCGQSACLHLFTLS
jgi:hypothetical protein